MHMQTDHLELYALGVLPEDLSSQVESHIKICVPCGIQFEQSRLAIGQWVSLAGDPAYTGPENRRSPRVAINNPAVLTVLKPDPSPRIKMRILDASREGLKLQLPHSLMTGTLVQVHVRDLFILAEVRYSRRVGSMYHAGVQIHDVFPACG